MKPHVQKGKIGGGDETEPWGSGAEGLPKGTVLGANTDAAYSCELGHGFHKHSTLPLPSYIALPGLHH